MIQRCFLVIFNVIWLGIGLFMAAPLTMQASAVSNELVPPVSDNYRVEIHHMDQSGLVLEFTLNAYQLEEDLSSEGIVHIVSVNGLFPMTKPGFPLLPSLGKLIGTPVNDRGGGIAQIRILELNTDTKTGIVLATTPRLSGIIDTDPLSSDDGPTLEAADYQHGLLPASPVAIGSTGKLRNQPFAQLLLHPFQYDAKQRVLHVHRRIKVAIDFVPMPQRSGTTTPKTALVNAASQQPRAQLYDGILHSSLLNYAAFDDGALPPQTTTDVQANIHASSALSANSGAPRLKITVDEDGIYRLSYAWMKSIGYSLEDVDPGHLQLHNQGREIAIYIQGEDDGTIDDRDWILFYGESARSPYTTENVYWLSIGSEPGLRMEVADGSVESDLSVADTIGRSFKWQRWESNRLYWKDMPVANGFDANHNSLPDLWFWKRFPSAPTSEEFPFTLQNVSTGVSDDHTTDDNLQGMVIVRLHGRTATAEDPDHHTKIYLNDRKIDDFWWDGQIPITREVPVRLGLLLEGENVLKITMPGDTGAPVDSIYFDYFEIGYWREHVAENQQLLFNTAEIGLDPNRPIADERVYTVDGFDTPGIEVYDIRDPLRVRRIVNGNTTQSEATYRVDFRDASSNVFSDEQSMSARYLVMDVGAKRTPLKLEIANPIQLTAAQNQADYIIIAHADFLNAVNPLAAYRSASGLAVKTVDIQQVYDEFSYGLFDPQAIRDFLRYAYHQWQPPSPLYVLLVGDANYDYLDNLETGHPNYVPTHLFDSAVIGQTPTDNWFVSVSGDDQLPDMFVGRIAASAASDVQAAVRKILAYETMGDVEPWALRSLFVAENEANFQSVAEHLIDKLPYNYQASRIYGDDYPNPPDATPQIIDSFDQGLSLVTYIGHGSVTGWYWNEQVLNLENVSSLQNSPHYPFVIAGNCNNGLFAHPEKQVSLAEHFMNADKQGAIGVWSPTGLGYTYWHEQLIDALYGQFFEEGVTELGPATTAAKIEAFAQLGWQEPVEISTLFGDPALSLHIVQPALDLEIESTSDSASPGQPYSYRIRIQNSGAQVVSDLAVNVAYGAQSTFLSAIPMPSHNQNSWLIENLASDDSKAIELTVTLDAALVDGSELQLTATLSKEGKTITSATVISTVHVPMVEAPVPDNPAPPVEDPPDVENPTPPAEAPPGQGDPAVPPTDVGTSPALFIPLSLH